MYVLFWCLGAAGSSSELKPAEFRRFLLQMVFNKRVHVLNKININWTLSLKVNLSSHKSQSTKSSKIFP